MSFVATKMIFVAALTNDSFKGKPLFQATKQHISNTLKKERKIKRGVAGCGGLFLGFCFSERVFITGLGVEALKPNKLYF